MSKILISYRRKDSDDVTGWIYDRLMQQFGRESVFKDVDSIPLGVDFRTYLDAQVANWHVFLAVIGRDWMKTRGGRASPGWRTQRISSASKSSRRCGAESL